MWRIVQCLVLVEYLLFNHCEMGDLTLMSIRRQDPEHWQTRSLVTASDKAISVLKCPCEFLQPPPELGLLSSHFAAKFTAVRPIYSSYTAHCALRLGTLIFATPTGIPGALVSVEGRTGSNQAGLGQLPVSRARRTERDRGDT